MFQKSSKSLQNDKEKGHWKNRCSIPSLNRLQKVHISGSSILIFFKKNISACYIIKYFKLEISLISLYEDIAWQKGRFKIKIL